jgi:hypothetical protein
MPMPLGFRSGLVSGRLEGKNLLPLSGIKRRLPGHLACSQVAVSTELQRLLITTDNKYSETAIFNKRIVLKSLFFVRHDK